MVISAVASVEWADHQSEVMDMLQIEEQSTENITISIAVLKRAGS